MLKPNKELIKKATKSDWAFVRSAGNFTYVQISHYKAGRVTKNIVAIENLLIKSIENTKNLTLKHQEKIEKVLKEEDPKKNVTALMDSKFSK